MARAARFSSRVDVAIFVGCLVLSGVALSLPAPLRDPLASSFRRSFVAPFVTLQRGAERWRAAWIDRERERTHTDSLALQVFSAQALSRENDQLRSIMGLGSRLQWGFVPAEALQLGDREDVVTTVTLTAGANAGVRRYSPVVAPEGIVGLVQTADPTLSIAVLYSHPDFRASAMSSDGAAFGIVYPHLGAGAQRYLLELRGVPFRTSLKTGTLVLTSGLGGSFPRGIPIGTVIREMKTAEGWTRTYLVQPSVNPGTITGVMILSPRRAAGGVGEVWASMAQVDSAARRIVAAGDSLGRAAALAEAAARRAAQDSANRAGGGVSPVVTDTARRVDSAGVPVTPRPRPRPRPDTTPVRRDTAIVGPPGPPAAPRPDSGTRP